MSLARGMREALACFEAFRRLGFESKDIYLVIQPWGYGCGLQAQGIRYLVPCGDLSAGENAITQRWKEMVTRWNTDGSDRWREQVWRGSIISSRCLDFVTKLVGAGFALPAVEGQSIQLAAKRLSGGFKQ